jgi:hypothetical protein
MPPSTPPIPPRNGSVSQAFASGLLAGAVLTR